jgi:acyl-CoA synthetase (NDP forming)
LNKTESPFFNTIEDFEKYMLDLIIRFAKLVKSYQKPFLGSSFYLRSERLIREVEDLGIPILPSPERSANAMGALYRYSLMRKLMVQ